MVAFSVHHLNGSLLHSVMDFPQCTVPDEHIHQVSRISEDMVLYFLDSFAPCLATSQAAEYQTDLKTVFHISIKK